MNKISLVEWYKQWENYIKINIAFLKFKGYKKKLKLCPDSKISASTGTRVNSLLVVGGKTKTMS